MTTGPAMITVKKWRVDSKLRINNVADDDTALVVSGRHFSDNILNRQIEQTASNPVFLKCNNTGDFEVIVEPA